MNNFLEYITGLAPEGETALIVRQKPQLKDGEQQFHADGVLKCTWPSFLPGHKMHDNEAWYGNTGSFIVDRFTEGKPSASSAIGVLRCQHHSAATPLVSRPGHNAATPT